MRCRWTRRLLDTSGYYALARQDPASHNDPKERQVDFFGGLRWRFEEHVPRTAAGSTGSRCSGPKAGLRLRPDFTFNEEEYNTYACPWHHNLTAAVCSFRTAKALRANPGSLWDNPQLPLGTTRCRSSGKVSS